jgi:hypothetical protein
MRSNHGNGTKQTRRKQGKARQLQTNRKQQFSPALLSISAIDSKWMKLYIVFMARLIGAIKFTGSVDNLCFYKMYGDYFVRTKSSLTGKRFWKDTAFEGSRRSCGLLAKASALTSPYYRNYPKEKRRKGLFNEMTGKVKLWLKEGNAEEEVRLLLEKNYPALQNEIKGELRRVKKTKPVSVKTKEKLFTVLIDEISTPCKRKHTAKRLYCIKQ